MTPEQALGELLVAVLPMLKVIVFIGCFLILLWLMDRIM